MAINNEPIKDPFEEYKKEKDPTRQERAYAWSTAIGLQAVDALETSEYLINVANRNISGEITVSEAQALVESYYRTDRKAEKTRTEEADVVSSRIASLLSQNGFVFSPGYYLHIHEKLFSGIYKHAGKIRDYNITKKEWVLDGDTVIYGGASELRATLEYDFSQEREFDYSGLSMDGIIKHLARFISRLWQIHVFGEGNTRTTAVFFIMYLRSKGLNVTNDIFAKNAWYFRNSMVRANYTNLKKGIHETTEYLELFLRNLLLGENNPLKNRTMHISGLLKGQAAVNSAQEISEEQAARILADSGLTRKTAENGAKLFSEFRFDRLFSRSDAVSVLHITTAPATALLNKLHAIGATEPVNGFGKGKYRLSPAFFKTKP
jgi:fido (protein-threonine AMPylation protein)